MLEQVAVPYTATADSCVSEYHNAAPTAINRTLWKTYCCSAIYHQSCLLGRLRSSPPACLNCNNIFPVQLESLEETQRKLVRKLQQNDRAPCDFVAGCFAIAAVVCVILMLGSKIR